MMLQTDLAYLAPVLGGVLAGGLLQGFVGFGFAIAAVPLIGLFTPPAFALPYAMVLQAVLGLTGLPGALKHCRWPLFWWLTVGMAIGTPIGLLVITGVPAVVGRFFLGIVVAAAFALILAGRRLSAHVTTRSTIAAGLVAGVMNGLAGMAGPPAVALVMSSEIEPKQARATLLVFVFGAALTALLPLGMAGRITRTMTAPLIIAIPVLVLGWLAGAALFQRTSARTHKITALLAIGLLATATLLRASLQLIAGH